MAGTVNARGILAWDNDVAPCNTITVDVEITYNFQLDNGPQIDPLEDDSYKTEWIGTGNATAQFVFNREAPAFDDFAQTANAFALVRGAGSGSNPTVEEPRSCYTMICGSDGFGFDTVFEETGDSIDIDWQINYTRVGPDMGGTIPTNTSGTATGSIVLNLTLSQSGDEVTWSATFYQDASIPSLVPATWGITIPSGDGGSPIAVFVHNLKTDPGNSVDFGDSLSWAADSPDSNDFNITSFTVTGTAEIVCS